MPRMTLGGFQQPVELLGIELETLQQPGRPSHRQRQPRYQWRHLAARFRWLLPRLEEIIVINKNIIILTISKVTIFILLHFWEIQE